MENICFNCFNNTSGFGVCPYCGYVEGTPNTPEFSLQPKTRLWGRYLIGTVLGIGGFGITYKAFDTRLSSVVAIKEFFPQNLASRIPGELIMRLFSGEGEKNYQIHKQRFIEEGKNLAKFTGDAHIVNVFDAFEDNNTAYIVMEYLEGSTLKEYLQQSGGALEPQLAKTITEGILQGVKSIHLKGIIHRDISPDNIYLLKDGRVKILDFGAARFAAKDEWTQSVVVKKGYAPPEQYRNNMRQTELIDLYAVGATYYKMLTGKTPEESIERWVKDTLVRPSKLAVGIDEQTDKLIMKSMALKLELRFKNADAMLGALCGSTNYDYPEQELKKIKRRQFIGVSIAAVMLCSVIGFAAWGFLGASSPPPTIVELDDTLADMQTQAETIVFAVEENDNKNNVYGELAQEFMNIYPEHEIILQSVSNTSEGANADIALGEDVFAQSADLSLLASGLDGKLYYNLGSGINLNGNNSNIEQMPVGFELFIAAVPQKMAEDEIFALPDEILSMDDYWQLQNETGFQLLHINEFIEVAKFYLPALLDEDNNYTPEGWQDDVKKFAEFNYRTGYMEILNDPYRLNKYADEELAEDFYKGKILTFPISGEAFSQISSINAKLVPFLNQGENGEQIRGNSDNYLMSVNAQSTENKQLVAMQFIHFVLSEQGQTILHVQNENALPLNKTAMQSMYTSYPQLENLQEYFDYERAEYSNFDINNLDEQFIQTLEKASYVNNNNKESEFEIKMFVVIPGLHVETSDLNENFVNEVVDYFMNY